MENSKGTPVIDIEGVTFLVDVHAQELRELEDPNNRIAFLDMRDKGDRYVFSYDPEVRNLPSIMAMRSDHIKRITIPQMIALDPEGVAARYQIPLKDLYGKTDFDLIVDPGLLERREAGLLPKIDIAGEDFIIDIRLNELRLATDSHTSINLKDMYLSDDGKMLEAYYDQKNHRLIELDTGLTEYPEGVVGIMLPNIIQLDPVGVCKLYGIEEREFLRRFPPQKSLSARLIPLQETGIASRIQINRALQQDKVKGQVKTSKGPHL